MQSSACRNFFLAVLICTAGSNMTGCSVKPPETLNTVPVGEAQPNSTVTAPSGTMVITNSEATGERYNPEDEQAIGARSLEAWREAVAHAKKPENAKEEAAWKKTREQDEKSSMAKLESLAKDFPTSSTVQFMMGQVKEHFGKSKEAHKYFALAKDKNTNNPLYMFKLAENERKTQQFDLAERDYQQVLKIQPDFYAAKLGLARCLIHRDARSNEAKVLATEVLKSDSGADANKQAQEILSSIASKSDK